jgi:UDP-glucose 4-epimerase
VEYIENFSNVCRLNQINSNIMNVTYPLNEIISDNSSNFLNKILLIGGCGYIGSYLFQKLEQSGFQVTICDKLKRGNPLNLNVIQCDYIDLTQDFLKQFDAVLWFGGHSSVGESITDPDGAITNNCINLFSFAKRLSPLTKFIYASSASLYSTKETFSSPSTEDSLVHIPAQNPYDMSKFAFDYLAKNFLNNFYALRMGTLSGYSPNLRPELVFNAMNLSAVNNGHVRLKNRESMRTILFLSDLWTLIYSLLTEVHQPGVYNAGSLSFKMGDLASSIAKTWNADVIDEGNSETYSFKLDTSKMMQVCGNNLRDSNIETLCLEFIAQKNLFSRDNI